jgi:hypothetical protein
MRRPAILMGLLLSLGTVAIAQQTPVPSAAQQIALAVLPLPEPMRQHATVMGYEPDLSLVTLRTGTNGMVCTAFRPGSTDFDVRCYHESFMPVIKRLKELFVQNLKDEDVNRTVDAEVRAKKLTIPDHPTAGYRMLGPMTAYNPVSNTVGKEIASWQSIHFPYKTAAEIGLPKEGEVPRTMPYVMASGTIWSHVMIEH